MRRIVFAGFVALVSACGGIVRDVSLDAATDTGSVPAPSPVTDASVPPSSDGGPGPGCAPGDTAFETGSSCRNDDEIRATITSDCGPKGVASVSLTEPCSSGTWRYNVYTCCNADGTGCGPTRRDGSDTSCKPEDLWRSYSTTACATEGKILGTIAFEVPCGGAGTPGHRGFSYACCVK